MVRLVLADRTSGTYAYSKSSTLCYSALFHAGRFDDLLAVLALDPRPYWHDQQWAAKALAARGDVDGGINLMEGLRSRHAPDMALSAVAEELLLDAGRIDEAYARYGTQATSANTHIATFRAIAKRYPGIEPSRILGDLIASTPGEEGKWFATAKTLKQYDLALALRAEPRIERCGQADASGVVEGLDNKVKVTMRKSYGFRTFRITEIALYHLLGKLPEPELTHRFY
jgi:hypothetical protein